MNGFRCRMKNMGARVLYFPLSLLSFYFPVVGQEIWLLSSVWSSVYILCGEVVGLLRMWNYKFRNGGAFSRLTSVSSRSIYWIAPSPSFRQNSSSGQQVFTDLNFTVLHLFLRDGLCNGVSLQGCFWHSVSRHSVPLSEKLWKPSRDYIKLTSRKIKNTKTTGAKQLNRRRETKEPVYEEVLPIPVRKAQ